MFNRRSFIAILACIPALKLAVKALGVGRTVVPPVDGKYVIGVDHAVGPDSNSLFWIDSDGRLWSWSSMDRNELVMMTKRDPYEWA